MLRDIWWGAMDGKLLSPAFIILEYEDGHKDKFAYSMDASRIGMEMKEERYEGSTQDCWKMARVFEQEVDSVAVVCRRETPPANAHTPSEWVMEIYLELIRRDLINDHGRGILPHYPNPWR